MRVLLAHKFFNLVGGAEVFVQETARILQENGHDVHFLTTGNPDDVDWSDAISPSQVTFVDPPEYRSGSPVQKLANLPKAIWSTQAKKVTADLLKKFQPDLLHCFAVHVHLSPSILATAKEAKIATVMTCNDYKHICPNYKLFHHGRVCEDCAGSKFFNAVKNRCAKDNYAHSVASALEAQFHASRNVYGELVDHYTFSSDFMAKKTIEFWPDREFSWSKLRNPFNSRDFTHSMEDDGYALYFGRLVEEKGVSLLLEAAKLCPDVPIKIVGDGPELERLQSTKRASNLDQVDFLGPVWGDALTPILKRARCIVVPSLWHENFPYVINQAFAVGRPVIGANRGGIPELVADGERGLVFKVEDVGSLAKALDTLNNSTKDAARMGQNAKLWSDETFSDQAYYTDLLSAYEGAIHANSDHGR
ncbi:MULTISPECIES: glycosyltransferase [Halocynthiibacter]|uniref:Glycosyltransferase n=1 Tax=Halocynthiibacter halioticoli TaxID=2986804 RepID=A0AAE3IZ31_9RHOB|nr:MULTISPECIES: glycosyltransferase [Halocynthiibacter]MCV6823111.1 glycosyltransferase [Halocynthiibacter halioticoli]MCW4056112.1 glycosyltransferase [Halocynthiibacter sp. SDUM655004]